MFEETLKNFVNVIDKAKPQSVDQGMHHMAKQRIEQSIEKCRINVNKIITSNDERNVSDICNVVDTTTRNEMENVLECIKEDECNVYECVLTSAKNILLSINLQKESTRRLRNIDYNLEKEIIKVTGEDIKNVFSKLSDIGYEVDKDNVEIMLYSDLSNPLNKKINEIDNALYNNSKKEEQRALLDCLANKTIMELKKNSEKIKSKGQVGKTNNNSIPKIKSLSEELRENTNYIANDDNIEKDKKNVKEITLNN